MAKCYIIDGNSLLFRAYYATAYGGTDNIMRTKTGIPTNAVFALANMINKILGELKEGDYLFVGFDTGKKTFRHEQNENYKANRKAQPKELIDQMPIAREMLKSLGIFVYEKEGFEGDDLCGTISKLASDKQIETIIYTSDRDFLQLINHYVRINILKTGMSNICVMDENTMPEKYGFQPKQIIDYKGLKGDDSDNLPGIPGVGDKTAVSLIQEYGDFESIVKAAESMKSKVGQNIVQYQFVGRQCRELAIIKTDVEIPFTLDDLIYKGYNFEIANEFCNKYELKQLLNRLPTKFKQNPKKEFSFREVTSFENINIGNEIGIALDIDAGNYNHANIYGLSIATKNEIFYIEKQYFSDKKLLNILKDNNINKFCFDFKKIKVSLNRLDIDVNGLMFDVLLCAYILDSSLSNNEDQIFHYFGIDVPTNNDTQMNLFSLSNGNKEKTCFIANTSLEIANKSFAELDKINCLDLYKNIEIPLATVLSEIEIEGMPLNVPELKTFGITFKNNLEVIKQKIYNIAGFEFNIDSPKQVGEVLFDKLGLNGGKSKSTNVDTLKELVYEHPVVNEILNYRKYSKLLSTYIEGLSSHVFTDGKLHAIFNQALTTTGRLSSSEPNLQNISVRDEEGKQIRKAFYYDDEDYSILSLDYSQIELRILASLSNCQSLIEIFKNDEDIHAATAKKVFHVDKVDSNLRRKAKAVNFGIIYGISDFGLKDQIGTSIYEAREIINGFHEAFPEVGEYFRKVQESAVNNGYVTTLFGRRRYLREVYDSNYQKREFAKRAAMNAPIQGTAADLIKIAMIKVNKALKENNMKTKIISQIHDELLFKVPTNEKDKAISLIKDIMENAIDLNVNLKVDGGYGRTWYDCK